MPSEPTGTTSSQLIILRGNSGSGKSTIARAVRAGYGYGCALVEQDYLRRIVLRERDVPGGVAAALIAQTVRFALDAGYHVICEGILHRARYGQMLTELCRTYSGRTSVFYLDASLDETLRRHAGRPQASDFTGAEMRSWYTAHDLLGVPGEHVIGADDTLEDTVRRISAHLPPRTPDDPTTAPPAAVTSTPTRTPRAASPTPTPQATTTPAEPPRKRSAATMLFTDENGHVLIVKPTYKPGWELPGGVVEHNESPRAAAIREIGEELGRHHEPGALLALDHVPATAERGDGLVVVFDGGILAPRTPIRLPPDELAAHAFVHPDHLDHYLPELQARRAVAALRARHQGSAVYLDNGRAPQTLPHRRDGDGRQ